MATELLKELPAPVLRVGGDKLAAGSGGYHRHINPYDGTFQGDVPLAGREEVDQAVEAALAVADEWRSWRPEQRREVLLRHAELIRNHREEFGRLGALDNGMPITMGRGSADLAAEWTAYYAGWCDKIDGDLLATYGTRNSFSYTAPEPYGVIGVILTWNGPLVSLGMSVPAPLAAGNCVVVKPSELTPFSAELYADLADQAGIPAGVISVLPGGAEAGDALVRHPRVDKISFVGGPTTARKILAACAESFTPSVMELGGKSAGLVFPDCDDLDAVAQRAAFSAFGKMSGQACAVPTRLVIHEDLHDELVAKVCDAARAYTMGDPLSDDVQMGPVINAAAQRRILAMIDQAVSDGAGQVVQGGNAPAGQLGGKNFVEPTVLIVTDPSHEIAQTEVFGPVLLVFRFTDEDEAIKLANDTDYGLAAYIESNDLQRVHRVAERLRAGGVYVNGATTINPYTPYGGLGLSGYGKQGGRVGIDEFVRYKTVSIA
ncbi:aldehyde dehydrogenase [Aeromicrobium sp. YIM 150415]|uniref:aldehyde dehydrogenase family protein n=1 Tax=Aeromicrobium sp. YIM 150415 TaxID=2803912 RepID=UPI001962C686|nr:aldehyde dehydrogenase family protein [Aeromicrobium sp. YIM 150415]MBM9463572.1 aldehyde dehydrogenase [Aeromicrobium sp. YIM 150415]